MATVVTASIPAEEFALKETLESVHDVEFECERIVETSDGTVMPLVWARGSAPEEVDAALREDASVESFDRLATFDDEILYRMEWVDRVELVIQMITGSHATVMDAYGDGRAWALRVLFPGRDELSDTAEFCEERQLTFDVMSVREMDGEPSGRYGLTEEQHVALTTACKRGYFEVPRRVDLDELADELDISHQSLSERLRRGHQALIEDTLLVGEIGGEAELSAD